MVVAVFDPVEVAPTVAIATPLLTRIAIDRLHRADTVQRARGAGIIINLATRRESANNHADSNQKTRSPTSERGDTGRFGIFIISAASRFSKRSIYFN